MPAIGLALGTPFVSGAGFQAPVAPSFLLLEDGFYFLLESGDKLILG